MNYQLSGRYTIGGAALGLAAGAIGGSVVAYAYGAWVNLIPEVHLAAFASIAFGALVGVSTGFGLVWGRVRNKMVALATGAMSASLALYLSWAVWIQSVLARSEGQTVNWMKLAQHPGAMWYLMKLINQYGTWTLDNSKTATTGWELSIVWILEAASVIGLAMLVAPSIMQRHPFCETCGQWCRRTARFFLAPVADVRPVKLRLESNDMQSLEAPGPGPKIGDRIIVDLESCETCGLFHMLNVVQMLTHRRKFGHPQVTSQKIVSHLILGPGEAQTIRHLSEKMARIPKLAPEKARGATAGR
jgi:heme exporter protein D